MSGPGLLVTGANGHLGSRLLSVLAERHGAAASPGGAAPLRALVRSPRAAASLVAQQAAGVDVVTGDPADVDSLAAAMAGCRHVVHLVGIIREGRANPFARAHQASCAAVAAAAARTGVERIVYLSLLGADPASANAAFASRGAAEQCLLDGPVPALVLRVPMVLGEGDYATAALARRARARVCAVVRPGSLEQPIDARDVIAAVLAGLRPEAPTGVLELAGPESLPRAALIARAAATLGRRPRVLPVPRVLAWAVAAVLQRVLADPPVTVAMLGVLDHDDRVDAQAAAQRLGIVLTPLDRTLQRLVAGPAPGVGG